jgi:hypothetical protein
VLVEIAKKLVGGNYEKDHIKVWFQNRRQKEKKLTGKVVGGGATSMHPLSMLYSLFLPSTFSYCFFSQYLLFSYINFLYIFPFAGDDDS